MSDHEHNTHIPTPAHDPQSNLNCDKDDYDCDFIMISDQHQTPQFNEPNSPTSTLSKYSLDQDHNQAGFDKAISQHLSMTSPPLLPIEGHCTNCSTMLKCHREQTSSFLQQTKAFRNEIDSLIVDRDTALHQLSISNNTNAELRRQLQAKDDNLSDQELATRSAIRKKNEELVHAQTDYSALERELQSSKHYITLVEEKLAVSLGNYTEISRQFQHLRITSEQNAQSQSTLISTLQNQVQSLADEGRLASKQLAADQRDIRTLHAQLQSLTSERDQDGAVAKAVANDNTTLKGQVQSLHSELDQAKVQLQSTKRVLCKIQSNSQAELDRLEVPLEQSKLQPQATLPPALPLPAIPPQSPQQPTASIPASSSTPAAAPASHSPPPAPSPSPTPSPPVLTPEQQRQEAELNENNARIATIFPNYSFLVGGRLCQPDNLSISQMHMRYSTNWGELERAHGFIKCLFPLDDGDDAVSSGLDSQSNKGVTKDELYILRGNALVQHNIIVHLDIMLTFWGFEMQSHDLSTPIPTTINTISQPHELFVRTQQDYGKMQQQANSNPDSSSQNDPYYPVPHTQYSKMNVIIRPNTDTAIMAERFQNLLEHPHNNLRITRALKCLKLVGLDNYFKAFYQALTSLTDEATRSSFCPPRPQQFSEPRRSERRRYALFPTSSSISPSEQFQKTRFLKTKAILDDFSAQLLHKNGPLHSHWAPLANDLHLIQQLDAECHSSGKTHRREV